MRALAGFVIAALLLILPACGGGASPGPVQAPAATSAPSPAATSAPMETKDTDYGY